MQEAVLLPLAAWQNFYVIIGTAAATLTGLIFVVITLIAGVRARVTSGGVGVFTSPNVFHFSAALLVAAILSAPWQALWNAAVLLGLSGLGGMIYVAIVFRRAYRFRMEYQPVLEDWLWYMILPFVCYVAFVVAAILLPGNPDLALFVIAAGTVLLLFIGIHNAWDIVTYVPFQASQREDESQD